MDKMKIETPDMAQMNFQIRVALIPNSMTESFVAIFSDQISVARPLRSDFRDSSFASDSAKINVTEIFKPFSPNTTVKVV